MTIENKPVWLITGCSTGFGRALAAELLENGYRVAVTARDVDKVTDLVEINKDNALPLALDVTDEAQVKAATAKAEEHFGRIDVLVNNAGFGYFGSVEESDEAEVRSMFETNFWGLAAMTRAVLPKMRERRSGTIVNISSIGGFNGNPSVGYYNATKSAALFFPRKSSAQGCPRQDRAGAKRHGCLGGNNRGRGLPGKRDRRNGEVIIGSAAVPAAVMKASRLHS
jgi:NADP-dependent 3-hydroxy acid dehydrogenase YdfG